MWVVLRPGSTHWTHLCHPQGSSQNPAGMPLAKASSFWCCLGRKGRKEEKAAEVGPGHLGNPLECRCRSVLSSSSALHPPWPCQGWRGLIPQIPEHPQLPTSGTQRSLATMEQQICCRIPKLWVKKRIKKDPDLPTGEHQDLLWCWDGAGKELSTSSHPPKHPQHPFRMLQVMSSACWNMVLPPKRALDAHVEPKHPEVPLGGDLLLHFSHSTGNTFLQILLFPLSKGFGKVFMGFHTPE